MGCVLAFGKYSSEIEDFFWLTITKVSISAITAACPSLYHPSLHKHGYGMICTVYGMIYTVYGMIYTVNGMIYTAYVSLKEFIP